MADDDMEENWESLLDNGALDKKLEEMGSRQQVTKSPVVNTNRSSHCQVIIEEEVPRTQYTRPEPHVKILKRPMGVSKSDLNGERSKQQPIKSLQQREAEYAQARLRILGAAKSEEDAIQERLSRLQLVSTEDPGQSSTDCELSSSSLSSSSSPLMSLVLSRPEIVKVVDGVEITRSPKGPDGSAGFNLRR
ncbi:SUZ domain-containing protein 1 [Chamberlinius hualienensis]